MNLTGHIRQRKRKDGQRAYQIIVELPLDALTGKRKRKYDDTIIGSKKDAERALRAMMDELQGGSYIERSSTTLETWMPEWLELYVRRSISPTTYSSYLDNMRVYIFPALGKIPLQDLTAGHIQKFVNDLRAASPATGKPRTRHIHW